MTTYIDHGDAQVLKKIGINVGALIAVSFVLIAIVALVT